MKSQVNVAKVRILVVVSLLLSSLSFLSTIASARSDAAGKLVEFTRLEFGRDQSEGLVLVEQTVHQKPAYTLSYFERGRIVRTQVLVSGVFKRYRSEVTSLLKNQDMTRSIASYRACANAVRLVSKTGKASAKAKLICYDSASKTKMMDFSQVIARLKSTALGQEI